MALLNQMLAKTELIALTGKPSYEAFLCDKIHAFIIPILLLFGIYSAKIYEAGILFL